MFKAARFMLLKNVLKIKTHPKTDPRNMPFIILSHFIRIVSFVLVLIRTGYSLLVLRGLDIHGTISVILERETT